MDSQFPPKINNISKNLTESVIIDSFNQIEWRRISHVFQSNEEFSITPTMSKYRSECSNIYWDLIRMTVVHNQRFFKDLLSFDHSKEEGLVKISNILN